MTTELIVKTSTTNASLDLLDDVPVSLNFAIADIKDPSKRNGAFSKTVKLPGSNTNNEFFEHVFDVNVSTNAFNPNVRTECWVLQDSIEVFRGYLRLREINVELVNDTQKVTYDVNLLGDTRDLFGAIGDNKLQDLTWSDLDHTYNRVNQKNTWLATLGENYVYPLIDYGYNNFLTNSFNVEHFRPAVFVKEYIDRMFSAAGKTYTSSFFNSTWFKRWIIPNNGEKFTMSAANLAQYEFYAGDTGLQTANSVSEALVSGLFWCGDSLTPYNTSYNMKFNDDTTSPFVDTGGRYDPTTGIFTVGQSGNYNIAGKADFEVKFSSVPASTATIQLQGTIWPVAVTLFVSTDGGSTWNVGYNFTTNYTSVITTSYQTFTYSWSTPAWGLSAGDKIRMQVHPCSTNAPNYYHQFLDAGSLPVSGTVTMDWRFVSSATIKAALLTSDYISGQTLTFSDAIPKDIKQKDLLMSIIKMGNLYVDVDPNDTNNYIIEPRDDYYSSGVTKDWTSKLAINQNLNIKLMPEIDIKNFIWTYKSDSDYYNKKYEDANSEVYGTHKEIITNDFSDKTDKNEVIFSATPIVDNANNSLIIPKIFSYDGTSVKPAKHNIRILAYNGQKTMTGGTWDYVAPVADALGGTTVAYGIYPACAMVDDPLNPTESLEFGVPNEVFYTPETYTTNNIYNSKYSKFITEITDRDSRIVTAYFYLTPTDIAQFDFSDKIYVKDTLYFVNKISDYNKIKPGLTKVELLKIKTASAYTPTSNISLSVMVTNDTNVGMTARVFGMSPEDTNYGNADNVIIGDNNRVGTTGSFVSGDNNFVATGANRVTILTTKTSSVLNGTDSINLIGCSGVSVGYGCSGITLMNCEGLTIADFVYDYTGIGVENKTITTASNNLIELGESVSNPTEVTRTKTASFNVSSNVSTYFIDADHGANVTAQFTSASVGKSVTFKRTDASTNLFYITNTGNTATVDGNACSYDTGLNQWDSITVHYDGTNLFIL